jgi:hypothetical protein
VIGVRVVFENSTACRFVDAIVLMVLFGHPFLWGVVLPVLLIESMESLILAQDERWRRA